MNTLLLKDRVCVVTGAAGGIGRQIALTFAREGASIACLDVNEEAASTTAATITSIAIEVGYNTVKSFTRNFLRFMVMTPSSYRKAAQGAMGK